MLSGIDLTIAPGEVVAILGPSGSGKSTLLRTINHLESVDRGSVTVDGQCIGYERAATSSTSCARRRSSSDARRSDIVFQNFNLFPHLTALENIIEAPIAPGSAQQGRRARPGAGAARAGGAADKADHYPRQLSGGQQQRVAIARALALSPKVLLFDEPTSALDPELVGEVLDVIRGLARSGTTLIIVTHEIGFAREVADRVVFIDGGGSSSRAVPSSVLTTRSTRARGSSSPRCWPDAPRRNPPETPERDNTAWQSARSRASRSAQASWRSPRSSAACSPPSTSTAAAAEAASTPRAALRRNTATDEIVVVPHRSRSPRRSRRWRRAASRRSRPASSPSRSAHSCRR